MSIIEARRRRCGHGRTFRCGRRGVWRADTAGCAISAACVYCHTVVWASAAVLVTEGWILASDRTPERAVLAICPGCAVLDARF